ncbi:MAG: efflux RND transporter permease subunit [Candidatus Omnitrophota bacterium]
MALPHIAIQRPVTILMAVIIACLFGLISITYLPVELMPNISFGEISIIVRIRGGIPPVEVEERVTKPIEEAVGTVSHLKDLLSISKEAEATIVLSFEPGTNMNFAALEVREKFAKVKNKLPREIEKPVIANYRYSDYPIMILAMTSNIYSPEHLRRVVDEKIKDKIKRVGGVANVDVGGGRERKILVEVDQRRLAAHSLSLNRVISILGLNNLNLLAGEIERSKQKYLVRTIGEFENIEQIKNIGLTTSPTGSIIRLKDIAQVKDSYLDPTGFARLNVRPVVSIYIQKESTANTISVVEGVKEQIDLINAVLDKNIKLTTTFNQAEFIVGSIDTVKTSLLRGALLAIVILLLFLTKLPTKLYIPIFIFMGGILCLPTNFLYVALVLLVGFLLAFKKLRFILIIALAIPISVMITFAFMYLINVSNMMLITLNIMTLAGLALGIGMLVDNGIVVLENIFRHRIEGETDPQKAAILGSEEMTTVIIAGTLTTLVVFLPMLFMNVQMRLMYGVVGIAVTFSLVASLLVALTVVPLLSSKSQLISESPPWIIDIGRFYRKRLIYVLRNQRKFLTWMLLLFIVSIIWFTRLDKEFIGSTQQSDFTIFIRMPTGTRLEVSDMACKKVEGVLKTVPEVKNISSRVEPWISKVYVKLVPLTMRKKSTKEVIESIRPQVESIKLYYPQGETIQQPFIYFEEPQEVGTKEVLLDIFGHDYKILRELAVAMSRRIGSIQGLTDVKIRMREGRPEMGVMVDKHRAALYGLNVNDVALAIHAQMRGMRATYYHTESREVETIARIDEKYRRTFKDLKNLVLSTPDQDRILLKQVSDFKFDLGPSEIWRKNKSRMIQLSANVGNISLSKAVALIEKGLSDIEFPEEYFYRFGGGYTDMVESQKQFLPTIILMLTLVYMVLAGLFESYKQPLIIMFSVPLAIIGVVVALVITKKAVSMGVVVGLVLLGGIVVNNAIILIDRINQLKSRGYKTTRAIVTSCVNRLRPILMTTATTVLGLLPMALDKSESANLWAPLAITVISGLSSSTILTLFVVPATYLIFEGIKIEKIGK